MYPERVHQQRLELGEEEGGGHLDRHEEAHRGGAHVHGHHLGRQQRGDHAVPQPVARVGNWKFYFYNLDICTCSTFLAYLSPVCN